MVHLVEQGGGPRLRRAGAALRFDEPVHRRPERLDQRRREQAEDHEGGERDRRVAAPEAGTVARMDEEAAGERGAEDGGEQARATVEQQRRRQGRPG